MSEPLPSAPPAPPARPRRHLWRNLALGAVGFVAAWGAVIAVFGPSWFKRRVEERISQYIHRPAHLGPISVNPYTLTFRVDSVRITDRDGGPLLQWDRLAVTYKLRTFIQSGELDFTQIEVVRPYARFRLSREGALSIQDILDSVAATPSRPAPPLAIGHLVIQQMRVEWYDSARTRPFYTQLGPASMDLRDFTTRRDSLSRYTFAGRTEQDEQFSWKGTLGVTPFASEGEIKLDNLKLPKYAPYYGESLRAEVTSGTLGLEARYAFRADPNRRESRLLAGALDVRDLALRLGDRTTVTLGTLHVGGLEADAVNRTATLGELRIGRLALDVVRSSRGTINLASLVASAEGARPNAPRGSRATAGREAATAAPPARAPRAATSDASASVAGAASGDSASLAPWRWTVHTVALDSMRVAFTDSVPARVGKLTATYVAARLDTLSSDPDVASRAHGEFTLEGGGRFVLDAAGPLARKRGTFKLLLDSLPMFQADPWIAAAGGRLELASGRLHLDLAGPFDASDPARPAATVKGALRVDNLVTREREDGDPFLSWRSFRFDGIAYDTRAATLEIAQVSLDRPVVQIDVDSGGTSNLAHLFPRAPKTAADSARARGDSAAVPVVTTTAAGPAAARSDTALPQDSTSKLRRITVGKVTLANGAVRIADASVAPVLRLTVGRITGTTGRFDSDNVNRGELALEAMVDEVAPLSIKGQLNPLSDAQESILQFDATGVDLLPFSGFSGRYLGYLIAKGKMKTRLNWQVKQRRVKSENVLTLDGFTFGDKVNHPDATSMPVKLGFAVLRDRSGQIVLDVPVEGSLDDPDFSFGRVIVRALLNILRNIVTAPFKLLGSLFGGGSADLSEAPFEAGSSALTAEARSRLDALRKSLVERPDLKLSIEGAIDSAGDRDALRKVALERRLRLQAPALADTALLLPSVRAARLATEFATLFPTDSVVSAARARSRPLAEALAGRDVEARVLAAIVVGGAELQALAEARAKACRDYLASGEGAPVDRIFLAASGAAPVA
ncbi:MAG: DUF748 domain-containing protein, partial [Gemmatimonadetes bacterium]|nr:DUF748 domain-containing protein [Gemmatimonadota bacterium]